jgi:DNA-binding transcriptional LysR family regulator
MLTMRQIEAFRATIAAGTVTEAARILGITQPAVSRMLADLQEGTRLKLFERVNRQLVPTDEARLLYEEVETSFFGLEQIALAAESIRNFGSGHLRLISVPALQNLIVDAVAGFLGVHSNVSTSVEIQSSQHMFRWLLGRQSDIGVTTFPIYHRSLDVTVLSKADAICILPPDNPLCRMKSIRPRDLVDQNFISYRSDTMFHYWVDQAFRSERIEMQSNLEARSTNAVFGLVAAGLGVSVVPPDFPSGALRAPVEVRKFSPSIEVELVVVTPNDRPIPLVATELKQMLIRKYGQQDRSK